MSDLNTKRAARYLFLFIAYSIILLLLIEIFSQKISPYSTVFHYYSDLAKTTCRFFPIFAIIIFLIPGKRWSRLMVRLEQINTRKFLLIFSMLGFLMLSAISWFFYEGVPKGDAVNVFFQAKIFACGKLFAALPDYPDFFHLASMIRHEGKWFAMLPPGHALMLTPFYLLNAGWLCGPILGALSLILMFKFCCQYYDVPTAKLTTILAVISPYFLLLQASFLPHASGLLLGLLFFRFYLKAISAPDKLHYCLAGVSAGMLFLIRPYTAFAFIFPFMIYSLYLLIKKRVALKNLLLPGLGMIIFGLLAMLYNKALTGDFLTFPYQLHRAEGYNRIGFGLAIGAETFGIQGHNSLKAIINLGYNFFVTSLHLHGTPFLSLLPAMIFIWKGKKQREDYLLIAILGSLLLFHFCYWFHGVNPMGSRYYFEAIFAMLILNVRGIIFLSQKFADRLNPLPPDYPVLKNKAVSKILILILIFNLTIYLPQCAKFFKTSGWGETRKIHQLVQHIDAKTLVFIKSPELTTPLTKNVNMFIYGSGFNYNDPALHGKHLFVHWLGADQNQELMRFYPDRTPYIVTYKTEYKDYTLQPYFTQPD